MRGLAVCRLGDLDAPLHRSLFQRGPVEGTVQTALELPAQWLRVVAVDELHGAAGWQMNPHALRLTQRLGFDYSSDTRGKSPFMPVCNGELILCPQLPTTLPTLDELIGVDGITEENVHERLLELTRNPLPHGHVFTLHAEIEGMKLLPILERLLAGWRSQGYTLTSTRDIYSGLNLPQLPRHEVVRGTLPGRSGTLMLQGDEFLAAWKTAA